ncbi:MAG: DUF2911 domain-containing protein [Maribacter sp.]
MKKSLFRVLTLMSIISNAGLFAQDFNIHNPINLPDKSQEAISSQRIGYTDFEIKYHSPGTKGRAVWGQMVPYGQVWRAGANENTVLTLTHDVEIEGQNLTAGSYGVHLLPEEKEWTFNFSKNQTSWGSYFYNPEEDALRVTVTVETVSDPREWMSFEFVDRERAATSIVLSWADKKATLHITLDIDAIALDTIRLQLRSDAYWEWFGWCQAADYCAEYGINTAEALEWIDKSIELEEHFSNWDVKAKLLRQLGDEKGADNAIERALEVGSAVYVERYGRRLLNEALYDEAVVIFKKAIKKEDSYWRAHYNLGFSLKELGKKNDARKAFEKALEHAPASQQMAIKNNLESKP